MAHIMDYSLPVYNYIINLYIIYNWKRQGLVQEISNTKGPHQRTGCPEPVVVLE